MDKENSCGMAIAINCNMDQKNRSDHSVSTIQSVSDGRSTEEPSLSESNISQAVDTTRMAEVTQISDSKPDLRRSSSKKQENPALKWVKIAVVICWIGVIAFLLAHKNEININMILSSRPDNLFLAALFVWFLFALKSLTFFLYSGLLYLACGMLFPDWIAFVVCLVGCAIMVSVPFGLGRVLSGDTLNDLVAKYPKLKSVLNFQQSNEFGTVLLVRVIGRLPSDLVSLYFGSCKEAYLPFLLASVAAALPNIIAFLLMGTSIDDPKSPQFFMAVLLEIVWTICCLGGYVLYKKRKSQNHPDQQQLEKL